ncbi:MAG: PT domain-containing protein [Clostridiales bacterium]|nr:PT domain-containing protein [Clostridiales bacterium]
MKRMIALAAVFAAILSLAACKAPVTPDPTTAPATEAPAVTDVPTEAPTAGPAAEPTEAPTPEPTEKPKGTELDFGSCAELVLRLPWGNGDKQVFIRPLRHGDDDGDWEIPQHFNIIDGKVYVFDRYSPFGNGLLMCDPETGGITRISPDNGGHDLKNGEFTVMDGKLIFSDCMYDLATGKRIELDPIPGTPAIRDGVLMMIVRDGKCLAYRAVNYNEGDPEMEFLFTQATFAYDVFELDTENLAWVKKERIEMPDNVPHADPPFSDYEINYYGKGDVEIIGRDDGALFCCDRYMGTDDAGNHYIDSEERLAYKNEQGRFVETSRWRRIIKLSPEGTPVSYVDVYFPENYIYRIWDNYLVFKVDADGTVWYMCETTAEVLIYKITL